MIRLIQRRLIIPRGDTGSFTIPLIGATKNNSTAVFTIFDPKTKTRVFKKNIPIDSDSLTIDFLHEETVNIVPGRYLWDIKFYSNPKYDDVDETSIIDGEEVDSYYAGYTLPVCEIRETGDDYLVAMKDSEYLTPEQINLVVSALDKIQRIETDIKENVYHTPIIQNDNWYIWDISEEDYVDSGVSVKGENGITPNFSIGTVTTLASNDDATVEITGTEENVVINFGIPKGADGEDGLSDVTREEFDELYNYIHNLFPSSVNVGPANKIYIGDYDALSINNFSVSIEPRKTTNTESQVTNAVPRSTVLITCASGTEDGRSPLATVTDLPVGFYYGSLNIDNSKLEKSGDMLVYDIIDQNYVYNSIEQYLLNRSGQTSYYINENTIHIAIQNPPNPLNPSPYMYNDTDFPIYYCSHLEHENSTEDKPHWYLENYILHLYLPISAGTTFEEIKTWFSEQVTAGTPFQLFLPYRSIQKTNISSIYKYNKDAVFSCEEGLNLTINYNVDMSKIISLYYKVEARE